MKKAVFFVVLAMVVIGFCAAQSANDAQRIVGTWTYISGSKENNPSTTVWVFNANGSGTQTTRGENQSFYWGISATGSVFLSYSNNYDSLYFFLSPDGKRIIIGGVPYQKN